MKTNPATGYIEDEESPIKKYLDNEDIPRRTSEEESTSDFPTPHFPPEVAAVIKAPSYTEALDAFNDYYASNKHNNINTTLIPFGSGAFEAWWCGKDDADYPNAVHSPDNTITIQDINTLDLDDLFSLYSNIFYSTILTKKLPESVLIAVIARILRELDGLPVDYEEIEGDGIFNGVSYDTVYKAITSHRTKALATTLVQRFLQEGSR